MGKNLFPVLLLLAVGGAIAGSLRHGSALSTIQAKCGTDTKYKYYGDTNSCYKFHKATKSWISAYTTCVMEGGLLAVINSRLESGILTELTSRQGYGDYLKNIRVFLGFSNWEDGSWRTVKGQILNETGYANWRDGEPNNYGGYQRCGAMYYDGELDDDDCLHTSSFICEKQPSHYETYSTTDKVPMMLVTATTVQEYDETSSEPTSVTETMEILHTSASHDVTTASSRRNVSDAPVQPNCGTDTGYEFYENTNACYKFHDRATWQKANSTCVQEGGQLSVLRSEEQAKIFRILTLGSYREAQIEYIRLFLGFRKMEGSWITVQGQPLYATGYVHWRDGEPNNAGGHQYCGSMYAKDGELDDDDCDHKNPFICEKTILQQEEDSDANLTSEDDITTINTNDVTEVETASSTVTSGSDDNTTAQVPIPTDPAVCSLEKQQGPCTNFSKRWFFDVTYGACRDFLYGGCGGNGNRFASEQDCMNTCVQPADTEQLCRLPKIKGPCGRSTIRWYYDNNTRACTRFKYSCEGNANNFKSRELCAKRCGGDA